MLKTACPCKNSLANICTLDLYLFYDPYRAHHTRRRHISTLHPDSEASAN